MLLLFLPPNLLHRGVNDSDDDARRLLELTRNIRCKINLIVFNPHEGTAFQPSTPERTQAFRSLLIEGGHVATVRSSRGDDEMAACGQLGSAGGDDARAPPLLAPPPRLAGVVAAAEGGA
jgi:23S rRNA (adenine2503-C2)-methyltransferase